MRSHHLFFICSDHAHVKHNYAACDDEAGVTHDYPCMPFFKNWIKLIIYVEHLIKAYGIKI